MTTEEIISNWKKITFSLKKLYKDNDIALVTRVDLFRRLLRNLPQTIIVTNSCMSKNALIQGVINLYTSSEFYKLSEAEKNEKTFSFIFYPERAFVYKGYYEEGEELFSGDWTDALDFILNEVIKMPKRETLTFKQELAIKELTKQLKVKKGNK
jgi:hypothetical protein